MLCGELVQGVAALDSYGLIDPMYLRCYSALGEQRSRAIELTSVPDHLTLEISLSRCWRLRNTALENKAL